MTMTLLTENVAFPAFVWAVFLCQRAVVEPARRRDLLALAGLALAFFARTQLMVLAVVLPVAVLLHEVGFATASAGRRQVTAALVRALSSHRVLAVAYASGVVAAGVLLFADTLGAIVGNYTVPFSGDLLPAGVWRSAAAHLDQVVVGCGVLPFLLATAWAFTNLLRPQRREAHAFACFFCLLVPVLTLQVTSFDLRFTPEGVIQDRYLLYLAPLFAVGAAAMLAQRTHVALRLALLAATTAVFTWLLGFAIYDDPIIFWASPAAAFHPALVVAGDWLGLSSIALLRCVAVVGAAIAIVLIARAERAALTCAVAVAVFGGFEAGYVFDRFAAPAMSAPSKLQRVPRDWIDRVVPAGNSVALVPSPHDSPSYWWEAEYWNKRVDRVLRVDGGPTFSPFAATEMSLDLRAGRLRGHSPSEFLVVSPSETRFQLLVSETVFDAGDLKLVRVEGPYRLAWATMGITPDGWKRAGEPATLRFYGQGLGGRLTVVLTVSSSASATRPLGFTLEAGNRSTSWRVDPGGARPPVSVDVCVPPVGYADVRLRSSGSAEIPDGRVVAVHLDRIEAQAQGRCS
jgi:hypothetical protein